MTETAPAPAWGNTITGEGLPNPTSTVMGELGRPARRPRVGIDRRHRYRPERRPGLGIRALRRRHLSAAACPSTATPTPSTRSSSSTATAGGAGGTSGAGVMVTAARHPRGCRQQRVGDRLCGKPGGDQGASGPQVQPTGELLMSLGTAASPGAARTSSTSQRRGHRPDGSIYVGDGHGGQGMTTARAMAEGRESGATGRILKFAPTARSSRSGDRIGTLHGEFRTPHALRSIRRGASWSPIAATIASRFSDQDGNYLDSLYSYGRISGIFITGTTCCTRSTPSRAGPAIRTG